MGLLLGKRKGPTITPGALALPQLRVLGSGGVVNTTCRVAAFKASAAWEGADLSQQNLSPECAAQEGLSQIKPNEEIPGFVRMDCPRVPRRVMSDCSRSFPLARVWTSVDVDGSIPRG